MLIVSSFSLSLLKRITVHAHKKIITFLTGAHKFELMADFLPTMDV